MERPGSVQFVIRFRGGDFESWKEAFDEYEPVRVKHGAVGHWILIHAFRLAPASLLAPFTYTQIIWMPALGFLFFGDRPGFNTIIGAAIIVASGLYILYRERVHGDR